MSSSKSMERELQELRRGEIDLAAFFTATQQDWKSLGASMFDRWPLPAAIEPDDVMQEMLLDLLEERRVSEWDPAKGPTLARYVVWNACSSAARWLHGQRDALRRSGKAPGRFAIPLSALSSVKDGCGVVDDELGDRLTARRGPLWTEYVTPDRATEARELVEIVSQLLQDEDRAVFAVLTEEGGDAEAAAVRIDEDPVLGLRCRVGSLTEARAAVRRALDMAREIIERL
jgi:hypothetical protein